MIYIIAILFFIITYKYSSNFYYLKRVIFLHGEFLKYIEKGEDKHIIEYSTEVKTLFSKSKISDRSLSYMEPVGMGYTKERRINFLENIFVISTEITPTINQFFVESKGFFKYQMKQALNPLYWIDIAIFLPKYLFKYLDFNENSRTSKLLNILYWVISILIFIFEEEVRLIIKLMLNDIF